MKIKFYKYQGCGNDFIIIDNRKKKLPETFFQEIKTICDRRMGIGADGLILLQDAKGFDFDMIYYNADGNIGSMCGNGGRCIVAFAKFLKIKTKQKNIFHFHAYDGPHDAEAMEDNVVSLKMSDVLSLKKLKNGDFELNTGSPHYVKLIKKIETLDVVKEGKKIRHSKTYHKEGINVNFVQLEKDSLKIRTFERGVEDETLSCGTGVTAAALVSVFEKNYLTENNLLKVQSRGGDFEVSFAFDGEKFFNIHLIASALKVYSGELKLKK